MQAKVDAVTGVMQKNIEMALKNTDSIEKVDEKAVTLADSAQKFKTAGTALKRKMRCRYYKVIVFFGFLVAAILAAIIAYFVQKKDEEKPASG